MKANIVAVSKLERIDGGFMVDLYGDYHAVMDFRNALAQTRLSVSWIADPVDDDGVITGTLEVSK